MSSANSQSGSAEPRPGTVFGRLLAPAAQDEFAAVEDEAALVAVEMEFADAERRGSWCRRSRCPCAACCRRCKDSACRATRAAASRSARSVEFIEPAGRDFLAVLQRQHHSAIRGDHLRCQLGRRRRVAIVLHLRRHPEVGALLGNVRRAGIRALRLEERVERQRHVQLVGEVKPGRAVEPAEDRLPVARVAGDQVLAFRVVPPARPGRSAGRTSEAASGRRRSWRSPTGIRRGRFHSATPSRWSVPPQTRGRRFWSCCGRRP